MLIVVAPNQERWLPSPSNLACFIKRRKKFNFCKRVGLSLPTPYYETLLQLSVWRNASQGDQIFDFLLVGLLLDANYNFLKRWSRTKKMATFWATFCLTIFTWISSSKVGFVADVFRFQKLFYVDVLDFQIKLWCINFDNFGLVLATFSKIWANFADKL